MTGPENVACDMVGQNMSFLIFIAGLYRFFVSQLAVATVNAIRPSGQIMLERCVGRLGIRLDHRHRGAVGRLGERLVLIGVAFGALLLAHVGCLRGCVQEVTRRYRRRRRRLYWRLEARGQRVVGLRFSVETCWV